MRRGAKIRRIVSFDFFLKFGHPVTKIGQTIPKIGKKTHTHTHTHTHLKIVMKMSYVGVVKAKGIVWYASHRFNED